MNMILFAILLYLMLISATFPALIMHWRWMKEQKKKQRVLCGRRIVDSVRSNQNPEDGFDFEQLEQTLKNSNITVHTDLHGCTD